MEAIREGDAVVSKATNSYNVVCDTRVVKVVVLEQPEERRRPDSEMIEKWPRAQQETEIGGCARYPRHPVSDARRKDDVDLRLVRGLVIMGALGSWAARLRHGAQSSH